MKKEAFYIVVCVLVFAGIMVLSVVEAMAGELPYKGPDKHSQHRVYLSARNVDYGPGGWSRWVQEDMLQVSCGTRIEWPFTATVIPPRTFVSDSISSVNVHSWELEGRVYQNETIVFDKKGIYLVRAGASAAVLQVATAGCED